MMSMHRSERKSPHLSRVYWQKRLPAGRVVLIAIPWAFRNVAGPVNLPPLA